MTMPGVPRNAPPGRLSSSMLSEAIEIDFGKQDETYEEESPYSIPPPTEPRFTYTYANVTFGSQNIGGSNETERLRVRIDLSEWDEGLITVNCTAGSDFDLEAQYWDGAAWQPLGPTLSVTSPADVDLASGFQEGAWAALDKSETFPIVRIEAIGDGTGEDIYGLFLTLRRAN